MGLKFGRKWNKLCKDYNFICHDIFYLTDEYTDVDNFARMGLREQLRPSGKSVNTLLHFAQLIEDQISGFSFRKFDWGSESENMKK